MTIRPSWALYRATLVSPRGVIAGVVVLAMLVTVLAGAGPAGPYLALTIAGILAMAVLRGVQLFRRSRVTVEEGSLAYINASGRPRAIRTSELERAVRFRRGRVTRTLLVTHGDQVFAGFDHRMWPVEDVERLVRAIGLSLEEA